MTEETPEVVEDVTPADAETAFILIKEKDGSWKATVDVASAFTIERQAGRQDVKTGTREIYEFLAEDDISRRTAQKIAAINASDSQRTAEGVRQALSDRDIL